MTGATASFAIRSPQSPYSQHVLHVPRIPASEQLCDVPHVRSLARPGKSLRSVGNRQPLRARVLETEAERRVGHDRGEDDR